MKVPSLVDDGFFASVEDGSMGCSEGQGVEFLVKAEELPHESFGLGGNFDGDGQLHGTSLFGEEPPLLPKPRHHHQRCWLHPSNEYGATMQCRKGRSDASMADGPVKDVAGPRREAKDSRSR